MIEHHSAATLVQWASEVYSRGELGGVLASTSICFDVSVFEIFVPLANGGRILLVGNALELVNLSDKESVTLINAVPSAIEELVQLGAIPDSVQTINLAGEPLSSALVGAQDLRQQFGQESVRPVWSDRGYDLFDLYFATKECWREHRSSHCQHSNLHSRSTSSCSADWGSRRIAYRGGWFRPGLLRSSGIDPGKVRSQPVPCGHADV